MRRLATAVAVLLLLLAAAPLRACLAGERLTQQETACCRSMHGNCGAMAKMGCCRTRMQADAPPQLAPPSPSSLAHGQAIVWLAPTLPFTQTAAPLLIVRRVEHFPPGSGGARLTPLRI